MILTVRVEQIVFHSRPVPNHAVTLITETAMLIV